MKIIYDARYILVDNRFDGISRYSYELAHALARRDDLDVIWLVYDKRQLDQLPHRPAIYANKPQDGWRELWLPRTLNKIGADVVYSPFFLMGTLGKKYKLVLTIHDMIYFTHRTPPHWLAWPVRLGWWLFHLTYWPLRWQLNRADAVATVSDTARQSLLDARATKRHITTVPNAVSGAFLDSKERDHSTMNGVVYMGAFTPYKNVECVIDAVAQVPDVTLHLCGKLPTGRRPAIEARIAGHGITDRVVIYNGSTDDEYKAALAQARCAISASRLEGFGLPLLEAQQFGVPFVAADTPIFREVGQESVLFFDPDSPEQAAEHMRALTDKATSQKYIFLGRQNAARYSWDHSAAISSEVFDTIVGQKR